MKEIITIANGQTMPRLGFGVYQIPTEQTATAVAQAIETGYRHIDTAQAYLNETEVGLGIRQSGVARSELFLTSKIWVENIGYQQTKASIERSLNRLQQDYVDLMLIHQPYGDIFGAWQALQEAVAEGKVKSIGVSNFSPDRVVDLGVFSQTMPLVNQIEINPFHQRANQIALLQNENVVVQAWAPFAEGRNQIFQNPTLLAISKQYGKSVAQVIIRWLIEQNIVVLAKSNKPERMAENLNVFDFALTETDKQQIQALDLGESQFFEHSNIDRIKWIVGHRLGV